MQGTQANPFRWQVAKTIEAFPPLRITPKSTEREVRYSIGQQWVTDVLTSWLRAGRTSKLTEEDIIAWPKTFNTPTFDLETPMNVIMFWAGVESVMNYMANNVID